MARAGTPSPGLLDLRGVLSEQPSLYLTKDLFFSGHVATTVILLLYSLALARRAPSGAPGARPVVDGLSGAPALHIDIIGAYASSRGVRAARRRRRRALALILHAGQVSARCDAREQAQPELVVRSSGEVAELVGGVARSAGWSAPRARLGPGERTADRGRWNGQRDPLRAIVVGLAQLMKPPPYAHHQGELGERSEDPTVAGVLAPLESRRWRWCRR